MIPDSAVAGLSPGLPVSALLLLVSFFCRFPFESSSSKEQNATEVRKKPRMKALKGALKQGWESVRMVGGDVSSSIACSIIFAHLTSTVLPG